MVFAPMRRVLGHNRRNRLVAVHAGLHTAWSTSRAAGEPRNGGRLAGAVLILGILTGGQFSPLSRQRRCFDGLVCSARCRLRWHSLDQRLNVSGNLLEILACRFTGQAVELDRAVPAGQKV
jgi:hypothetical protein